MDIWAWVNANAVWLYTNHIPLKNSTEADHVVVHQVVN